MVANYSYPTHEQAVDAAAVVLSRMGGGRVSNAGSIKAAFTAIGYALTMVHIAEAGEMPQGSSPDLSEEGLRAELGTFLAGDAAKVSLLNWKGVEAATHVLLLKWLNLKTVTV